MTEIVQRRMELMTEEFEEMTRTKLFMGDESRKIIKKRKEFEYKINSVTKNLQDYKDYIEYEKTLLEAIRLRRNKFRISEKKGSLEHRIINRIKLLYETALQRFADNMTLHLSYFKFCKQANYVNAASAAIANMLKTYSHNPEIWQIAAKWHAYDRKDVIAGIKTVVKGIAVHKNSNLLYSELIQLELLNAVGSNWSQKNSENNELTDKQKLCNEKLHAYIRQIISNISDCKYYIDLLNVLEKYKFTLPVQTIIINYLYDIHTSEPLMWHTLAQRECNGLHHGNETLNSSTKGRLSRCFSKYQEGLDKVPNSCKAELWSFYLDCLIEQRQDDFGVANVFKANSLKSAFERACSEGYLTEKYYIAWLELVDDAEALGILEKGTTALQQSVELWKMRLRYQIIKDDMHAVKVVFQAGIKALQDKSLPLWTATLRYYMLSSDDDTIESFYKEGLLQPAEVSNALKPYYIEWLALTKGMKRARLEYLLLAKSLPYCKELHVVMSKLESTEIEYNFESWEKVHHLACEQFGKEDVDVWMNYVQFCLYYKRDEHTWVTIKKIYEDAQKVLSELLFLDFKDRYYSLTQSLTL